MNNAARTMMAMGASSQVVAALEEEYCIGVRQFVSRPGPKMVKSACFEDIICICIYIYDVGFEVGESMSTCKWWEMTYGRSKPLDESVCCFSKTKPNWSLKAWKFMLVRESWDFILRSVRFWLQGGGTGFNLYQQVLCLFFCCYSFFKWSRVPRTWQLLRNAVWPSLVLSIELAPVLKSCSIHESCEVLEVDCTCVVRGWMSRSSAGGNFPITAVALLCATCR